MNKIEMYFNCVKRVLKSTTVDLNISNKKNNFGPKYK